MYTLYSFLLSGSCILVKVLTLFCLYTAFLVLFSIFICVYTCLVLVIFKLCCVFVISVVRLLCLVSIFWCCSFFYTGQQLVVDGFLGFYSFYVLLGKLSPILTGPPLVYKLYNKMWDDPMRSSDMKVYALLRRNMN